MDRYDSTNDMLVYNSELNRVTSKDVAAATTANDIALAGHTVP